MRVKGFYKYHLVYLAGLSAGVALFSGSFCGCLSLGSNYAYGFAQLPLPQTSAPLGIGEFVGIAGGCFEMGLPDGMVSGEATSVLEQHWLESSPSHEECLPSFEIGKYEVTAREFCRFLLEVPSDTQCDFIILDPKVWRTTVQYQNGIYVPRPKYENAPATFVTYLGARAYCEWLSQKSRRVCRLPTEIEWEYAARGTQSRTYPWGEAQPLGRAFLRIHYMDFAPWGENPGVVTVGTFPEGATPEGVHDLIGNALEWCGNYYYDYPSGNMTRSHEQLRRDAMPLVPDAGEFSSFQSGITVCRSPQYVNSYSGSDAIGRGWSRVKMAHVRYRNDVPIRNFNVGFRVLREVESQ